METPPWDLGERTVRFTVAVIRFCRRLPRTDEAIEIAGQLRRSASSVGAHYRAAKRNKSDKDYINKVSGGIEEGDEALYWFEVLKAAEIATAEQIGQLDLECDAIVSILVKCRSTAIARVERNKAAKKKKRKLGN
jgi:four helix bundle protein